MNDQSGSNRLPDDAGGETPPGFDSLLAALAQLQPRIDNWDQNGLMFRAGQASMLRKGQLASAIGRWSWPASFAGMTAIAATLFVLLITRPAGISPPDHPSQISGGQQTGFASNSPSVVGSESSQASRIFEATADRTPAGSNPWAGDHEFNNFRVRQVEHYLRGKSERLSSEHDVADQILQRPRTSILTTRSWEAVLRESGDLRSSGSKTDGDSILEPRG